ncbi:MAG: hypothetical protein KKA46_20465 [Proteobacteria bacterium]|nr:hypothetical protein [Pseudomonadota bacterium]
MNKESQSLGQQDVSSENTAVEEQSNITNEIDVKFLRKCLGSNQRGDAKLFAKLFKDRFIFDHSEGRWYWFDSESHVWVQDNKNYALAALDKIVRVYLNASFVVAKEAAEMGVDSTDGTDDSAFFRKRVNQLNTTQRRKAVLELAAAGSDGLGITGDEWNSDLRFLPVKNGVIELMPDEPYFRPGKPTDMLKAQIPTAWPEDGFNARAPEWEKFLFAIFNSDMDVVAYLQRFIGYALSGLCNEDVFVIFQGQGRNGKSTLLGIVEKVFGELVCPIRAELLIKSDFSGSSAGPRADLIHLRNKRLAFASETGENMKLNEGIVKQLTGGDTIVARPPYGKREITFQPTHTVILQTNYLPIIGTGSYAMWQRVHVVNFPLSFGREPKGKNERQADPYLDSRLAAEAPGILAWAIKGYYEYRNKGLKPPKAVRLSTKQYQREQDVVGQFVAACCDLKPGAQTAAKDVYEAYHGWAGENDAEPMSQAMFGSSIKRLEAIEAKRVSSGMVYKGLALRDAALA